MKTIEVVAAIIVQQDKILCVQRGLSKFDYISNKWEFPGGKIEVSESKDLALKREILEELNLEIEILSDFSTVNHEYPDFNLIMHSFLCRSINIEFKLNEHIDFKWLEINDLSNLDWAAADLPIVYKLKEKL